METIGKHQCRNIFLVKTLVLAESDMNEQVRRFFHSNLYKLYATTCMSGCVWKHLHVYLVASGESSAIGVN